MILEHTQHYADGTIRLEHYNSRDYTYVVHHVHEPEQADTRWLEMSKTLYQVYTEREDVKHGEFADWLIRIQDVIRQGGVYCIYKYKDDTMVGQALVCESICVHYGTVLNVFAMLNTEGSARGFTSLFKRIGKEVGAEVYSRVKYVSPYLYNIKYTRI